LSPIEIHSIAAWPPDNSGSLVVDPLGRNFEFALNPFGSKHGFTRTVFSHATHPPWSLSEFGFQDLAQRRRSFADAASKDFTSSDESSARLM
jgi:hypothetical protein